MLPLAPHTILIVDDKRGVRMLQRIVLEGAGATVIEAADGLQAVKLLERSMPHVDLVVTDLDMPRLDGEGFARIARMRWPDVPIVACSGKSLPRVAPGLLRLADQVIEKPFDPERLVRTVVTVLGRSTRPQAVVASPA
jgi:CheY-like chemotaxis protein